MHIYSILNNNVLFVYNVPFRFFIDCILFSIDDELVISILTFCIKSCTLLSEVLHKLSLTMGACCQCRRNNHSLLYEKVNQKVDLGASIQLRNNEKILVSYGYIRKMYTLSDEMPLPMDVINLIVDFYGLIRSNIKGMNNPLTTHRMRLVQQGMGPIVHFDENVEVHVQPPDAWQGTYDVF